LSTGSITSAADLGTWGETYPVMEEDFLQFIFKRLKTLEDKGSLHRAEQTWVMTVKAHSQRPRPVSQLSTTNTPQRFTVDCRVQLKEPLRDADNRVLVPAGKMINPLEYVSLKAPLLFLDADDEKQRQWAKNQLDLFPRAKIILVKGDVAQSAKEFIHRIYFDQDGRLTQKFHLAHIPSRVIEHDQEIWVEEFARDRLTENAYETT
jgi:conjugal transfer pilus assembly protein TraW